MPKKAPLDPKTEATADGVAETIAKLILEQGVSVDELVRIDERVLEIVRRIGNKTIEKVVKGKGDLARIDHRERVNTAWCPSDK